MASVLVCWLYLGNILKNKKSHQKKFKENRLLKDKLVQTIIFSACLAKVIFYASQNASKSYN